MNLFPLTCLIFFLGCAAFQALSAWKLFLDASTLRDIEMMKISMLFMLASFASVGGVAAAAFHL